ncbi:hypothetical protein Q4566_14795 [Tamlana sp. 2_MG-2023]|uniref:hypothetical protein n=1 Tax=unclassified Tamlana TaxID=2614803 RepID=UPI0026E23BA4|nr:MULTISPECIES: hypothetical protein [unclassified Tamlana]MDO6761477.1 hypothetical protein [Tamlana sp. 2_MG-2023]MDO6792348.1 hypothetical protein [Tamlana sp. 1_MG-2023]
MPNNDTSILKQYIHLETLDIGRLYFFKNYVVAEFNEGVTIDFITFEPCHRLIKKAFGTEDFGFISNRVNSYSIMITEAYLFNKAFPTAKAYATVTYNLSAKKITAIEDHFFKFNKKDFNNLEEAVAWVKATLNN